MYKILGIIIIWTNSFALTFKYNNKIYPIESKVIHKIIHLNYKDIQSAIGFKIKQEDLTKKIILKYEAKKVSLYPGSPWIAIGDEIINTPMPPSIYDKKLWLPLPLLNEILDYFLGIKVRIEKKKLIPYESKFRIKKIVIDPGHGGEDPGAIGVSGIREKDVVLNIAKLVKDTLESRLGIRCILTRERDVFVPLRRRSLIANKHKTDLFISLHCNAHRSRKKEGVEVYFLSPAKTTWERAVEARENASLKYEIKKPKGEVESILWDLAQTEFLKESNQAAGYLVNSISQVLGAVNRGVKQANFYVLRGVYMPACLLEIEFITHPKWGKKLRTRKTQLQVAEGIVKGIEEFKKWYEERMNK